MIEMPKQPPNKGFIYEEPVLGKDGVFGSEISYAGKTVISPTGQWDTIEYERQFRESFDSFSCTSFGANNQEELYKLLRYGVRINHSDRALAKMSDTQPNGNMPQKVYEARRNKGFLLEEEWGWPDSIQTWAEYMAEIPGKLLTLALGRKAEWKYWHDYVFPTTPTNIRNALKYAPVAVSVALMPVDNSLPQEEWVYYKPAGWRDTHWAVLRGFYSNGDWKLLDTYPPFEKRVRADMTFEMAKVIEIERQVVDQEKYGFFMRLLRKILGYE
jgi:hypothetical protein